VVETADQPVKLRAASRYRIDHSSASKSSYRDTATVHHSYDTFGKFLNRYSNADFDSLDDELSGIKYPNMSDMTGNAVFDDSCDGGTKVWNTRPLYFIWNKYRFSMHKGQIADCN